MISSVPPRTSVSLSETALYQMCADLSDLLGAGWKMEIAPSLEGNPYTACVLFKRAVPEPNSENIPLGASIVRFSLAADLPTVVRNFHRRVFPAQPPISPIGDFPPKTE